MRLQGLRDHTSTRWGRGSGRDLAPVSEEGCARSALAVKPPRSEGAVPARAAQRPSRSGRYDTMYAAAPADMISPSGPRNSMRVLATREPSRSTLARSSKWLPMPGRR